MFFVERERRHLAFEICDLPRIILWTEGVLADPPDKGRRLKLQRLHLR